MENQEHLEALQDIRKMMKRSTRFLSLSGMSGVLAGIYALAGSYVGHLLILDFNEEFRKNNWSYNGDFQSIENLYLFKFSVVAFVVLAASLITGFLFSKQKAKKAGQKLLDANAWRLLFNLAIPLATAAVFVVILYINGEVRLVGPTSLIFYGLALLNASKYTLDEVRYLGICEIVLGLINGFFLYHDLYFWAFGFGVLHIVYGLIMWFKYDRKK